MQTVGYGEGFELQASGFGRAASGFRFPASAMGRIFLFRILSSFFRLTFPPEYS